MTPVLPDEILAMTDDPSVVHVICSVPLTYPEGLPSVETPHPGIGVFCDGGALIERLGKPFSAYTILHAGGLSILITTGVMNHELFDKLKQLRIVHRKLRGHQAVNLLWCMQLGMGLQEDNDVSMRKAPVTPLILSRLHALRLCFLLTLFVRPDRLYRLPDSLRTLPLSRYLAALVSTRLTMLTFLFRLRFSRSRCLSLLSSPLNMYMRESSLQILTQTHLLLTKYYTKLLSADYQVTDTSPYCIMNCSVCTCISSCR